MALPRPLLPVASSSSSAAAAAAAAESSSSPLSPPHEPDSSPRRLAQRPQPARPTRNDDKDDDEDDGQTGWRNRGGIRLVGSYRGDEEDREGSPVNASGTITNDDEQQEEEDKSSHLLPAPTPTPTPSISISSAPPRTGSTSSASVPPPPSSPTGMTRTGGYDDDDDDNQDRKGRRPSFSSSASSSVGTAASSTPIVDPRAAPAAIGTVSHDDGHPTALRTKKNRFRRSSKTKNQRKGPPRPPAASSSSSSSSDLLVPIGTSTHPVPSQHGETLPSSNIHDESSSRTETRRSALEAEEGGLSSSRRSSSATTTTTSGSSSKSLKQRTTTPRSHNNGSSTMLGFPSASTAAAAGSGSSDSSSLSLSLSASGSRSGPSTTTTTTTAGGGGEGRLARGLRKTRSGLKLFAARAAAAATSSSSSTSREQEPVVVGVDNPTSPTTTAPAEVLLPRDATRQADSPPPPPPRPPALEVPSHSEAAATTTTQLDSSATPSGGGGRSRSSFHASPLGDRGGDSTLAAASEPRPASATSGVTPVHHPLPPPPPQSPPSGNRIGGWFNSLMPTPTTTTMTNNNGVADQNPASPPMKARGSFAAVTSGPPKRRGSGGSSSSAGPRPGLMGGGRPSSSSSSSSPLKKASSSSAVTSTSTASGSGNPTGRFGPFDRMLDRAVQYFLDTDSHADRCEDEIWLLGVRHAGWDPEAVEEGAERPTMATRAAAAAAAAGEAGGGNGGAGGKAEGGRRGGLAGLVARRASPVKARKTQQQKSGQPSPQPMVAAATTASGDDPFVNVSSSAAASDPPAPVTGAHAAVGTATTSSSATATRIHGWPATFYRDFYSRVGLTYRSDFPLIECDPPPASPYGGGGVVHGMLSNLSMSLGRGAQRLAGNVGAGAGENSGEEKMQAAAVVKGLSSDTGWGCMLRTGQSLLANALVKIHLGRDWRRPLSSSPDAIPQAATYARILSLFLDDPSPLSPFSVHQFARQGKQLGKEIGEWFGPSTAAGAIKALVNAYEPAGLRVVSCIDGTVYESEVVEASTVEGTSWKRPVLVLVNVRLGLEGVNPVYHDSIKSVFRFPQSVGIAGGRPISSYYFVGAQADSLFYIDPHFPRPAVPLVLPSDPELVEAFAHVPVRATGRTPSSSSSASPVDRAAIRNGKDSSTHTADQIAHFLLSAYPDSVWATYHCDKVRKVSLSSLDPSMLIGFVVENASDWLDFRNRVQELAQSSAPMFTVAPSPPAWLRRSASATTAVRTASAGARNSLDDSFSVIGESRAGGDNDDNDDNDGFSEPEDWELQSTDDEGLRSSVLVERSTPPAQAAISRSPDDAVLL